MPPLLELRGAPLNAITTAAANFQFLYFAGFQYSWKPVFTEIRVFSSPKVNFGEAEKLKNENLAVVDRINASGQDEFSVKLISGPQ